MTPSGTRRYRARIVSFDPQTAVLVVKGDEDRLSCGGRRRALSLAIKAGCDVLVDMRGLRYADSSLMVDLAVLARRLRQDGRTLNLQGAQPQIQQLIELTGLHRQPAIALVTA